MSNKERSKLNDLDLIIRDTCKCGMEDGLVMTIQFVSGFEMFNSYENWGQGYKVTGRGIIYSSEDLDDAVVGWSNRVIESQKENHAAAVHGEDGE